MEKIYIFGSGEHAESLMGWLAQTADLSPRDVAGVFDYPEFGGSAEAPCNGIPSMSFDSIRMSITPEDIVLVVSRRFRDAVGDLIALGIRNIIDGHAALAADTGTRRLLRIAGDFRITQPPASIIDRDERRFHRYVAPPMDVGSLAGGQTFIVNSMPKSGSVWMMAMIERVLGNQSKHTVSLSHVLDIENDLARSDLYGAVVLVRDMRDVVVSWFRHLTRIDARNGFTSPRYPAVEEFYFDHFIGEIHVSPRYGFGNLEHWLNLSGFHGFPIIKYEQLVADAQSALAKLMTFWKLRVPEEALARVANECSFENMQRFSAGDGGFVAEQLKAGHLHRGKAGAWKDELPASVVDDISRRFAGYQRRLNYQ